EAPEPLDDEGVLLRHHDQRLEDGDHDQDRDQDEEHQQCFGHLVPPPGVHPPRLSVPLSQTVSPSMRSTGTRSPTWTVRWARAVQVVPRSSTLPTAPGRTSSVTTAHSPRIS